MPLSDTERAYLAGLFDGEGCVNFTQSGQCKTWVIRAMIRNTDLPVLEYVRLIAGGSIHASRARGRWKPSYCLRWNGAAAVEFLETIEPWARIKAEQILVARTWDAVRNRDRGTRRDNEYQEMILLLVEQLRWLNRKGQRGAGDGEPIADVLASLRVPMKQILAEVGHAA